jgi:hypothetical protein
VLSFAWLALPHGARAQGAQGAPDSPESCANEPWSEEVPSRSARALRIERTLLDAYTPPGEPARRTTGTLSAATLELMNRFCTDVRATGATVLASIDSLAEAMAAYPAWRDTIASPGFARWARVQPVGRYPGRIEDRLPRSPGAALLIDRYQADRTDGWFYLTTDEIKTLAAAAPEAMYGVLPGSAGELSTRGAPPALVERVQALETLGYRYPSYDSVDVRLDAIFALDAAPVPPANDPKELDAALLIVADALAQADATPATPPTAQYRDLVQIGLNRAADRVVFAFSQPESVAEPDVGSVDWLAECVEHRCPAGGGVDGAQR